MDKIDRYIKTIPPNYPTQVVGSFMRGLIEAWAQENDTLELLIQQAKNQIFVTLSEGQYLTALGSNVGVGKPLTANLTDDQFRSLIEVMSFNPKQVVETMYKLLDIFWGPMFSCANVTATVAELYNFGASVGLTGTITFTNQSGLVTGAGTFFMAEVAVGDYIKLSSADNTQYLQVMRIVDNTNLYLAASYEGSTTSGPGVQYTPKILTLYVDSTPDEINLIFNPIYFSDTTQVRASELVNAVNNITPFATGTLTIDVSNVLLLNLRTNTPGSPGYINITGGSANTILLFPTGPKLITDLPSPTVVYEVNNREIVVRIPDLASILGIGLSGSHHFHSDNGTVVSVDNVNKQITCNFDTAVVLNRYADQIFSQNMQSFAIVSHPAGQLGVVLQFGASEDLSGVSAAVDKNGFVALYVNWPGSYLYDPVSAPFTLQSEKTILNQTLTVGNIYPLIAVADASDIPNTSGYIVIDYGNDLQEGPILYRGRPTNSSLLLNPSYIFQKTHTAGVTINIVDSALMAYDPRLTGEDYAIYLVDPQAARLAAQSLIELIKAAGVVLRFIIDVPQYLFDC